MIGKVFSALKKKRSCNAELLNCVALAMLWCQQGGAFLGAAIFGASTMRWRLPKSIDSLHKKNDAMHIVCINLHH